MKAFFYGLLALVMAHTAKADNETLRQQVGQMVIAGFKGTSPEDIVVQNVARAIRESKLGGVILFRHNIASPVQLKTLTTFLQEAAPPGKPLFIAVDQEGGQVQRLKSDNGFSDFMSQAKMANTSVAEADAHYHKMAAELEAHGLNLNLGPVVDLRLNPESKVIYQYERGFSDKANTTVVYASSFVSAHRKNNVLTCLKHWPGHGSAAQDSHRGIVDVTNTWSEVESAPYQQLIAAGLVDAIMTAHVFHRGFDQDDPSTPSSALIQGLLRDKLGYEGVVISDCLQMRAITELYGTRFGFAKLIPIVRDLVSYGTEDAALKAIGAGVDIVLIGNYWLNDYDLADRLFEKIEERSQYDDGAILRRVEESNRRIAKLKERLVRSRDEL